jgi:hypothetical protein
MKIEKLSLVIKDLFKIIVEENIVEAKNLFYDLKCELEKSSDYDTKKIRAVIFQNILSEQVINKFNIDASNLLENIKLKY